MSRWSPATWGCSTPTASPRRTPPTASGWPSTGSAGSSSVRPPTRRRRPRPSAGCGTRSSTRSPTSSPTTPRRCWSNGSAEPSSGCCPRRCERCARLRRGEGRARRAVVAVTMQDERLHGEPVDLRVDTAQERADLAAGDALDRFAELPQGRVLEEHPRLAQPLVLAHADHAALHRRQRVLQEHHQHILGAPHGAGLGRATPELILVEPDHHVGDLHEDARAAFGVGRLLLFGGHGVPPFCPSRRDAQVKGYCESAEDMVPRCASAISPITGRARPLEPPHPPALISRTTSTSPWMRASVSATLSPAPVRSKRRATRLSPTARSSTSTRLTQCGREGRRTRRRPSSAAASSPRPFITM